MTAKVHYVASGGKFCQIETTSEPHSSTISHTQTVTPASLFCCVQTPHQRNARIWNYGSQIISQFSKQIPQSAHIQITSCMTTNYHCTSYKSHNTWLQEVHSAGTGSTRHRKVISQSGTFTSCVNSLGSTRLWKKALSDDMKVRKCNFRKEIL